MKKMKYMVCFTFMLFSFLSIANAEITKTCKYSDSIGNDVLVTFDENSKPTAYVRKYCKSSTECKEESGSGNSESITNWKTLDAEYKNNPKCYPFVVLNKESLLISFKGYVVTAGFRESDIQDVKGYKLNLYFSEEDMDSNNNSNSNGNNNNQNSGENNWNRDPIDYDVDYSVKDTDIHTICSMPEYRKPMKFVGILVSFVKTLVPLFILAFGAYDLYKAMTGSKDDEIKKAFKSIGIRILAGLFIFLLPGLIQFLLNMVNEWSEYKNSWCCCTECLLNKDCNVNACDSTSCHIEGTNE